MRKLIYDIPVIKATEKPGSSKFASDPRTALLIAVRYGVKISELGEGTFGTVFLYTQKAGPNKGSYAIKYISNRYGGIGSAIGEVAVLNSLNHPNVVKLIDYDLSGDSSILVLPAAKSDLKGTLLTNLDDINNTFYQMASSLCYIHSQGIIHKDIKPDNFLISNL